MTAKVPLKVHLRLRFQNLGKPRTAGLCGRAAGACDCGPLSCAKIERPSPLEKPSCIVQLFAQNRSRNYRQKVTATTLFQTASYPIFNFSHKRPTFAFTGESGYTLGFRRRIAHSGTHAETGGVLDGGGITALGAFRTFRNTLRGRVSERQTLPLLGLGRGCSRRTQKAFGTAMRLCVSLSRGVAAPLGCVICLQLGDVAVFSLCAQYFLNVRGGGGITTLGAFHTFRKPCVARG